MNVGVRQNGGFSLIELAIITTIVGLMVGTALETYRLYLQTKIINDTAVNSQAVQDAMARYIRNFEALPCPAGPRIDPNPSASPPTALVGAGKGVADTAANLSTAAGCANLILAHPPQAFPTPGYPWCDANNASPTYGICIVDGATHSTANPYAPTVRDPVLIGSLPYYDLGLTIKESLDGWGNRFTYAVSFYETQTSPTYSDQVGAINMLKYSYGTQTVGNYPGTGTANTWPFVILSHGADGNGSWDYYGAKRICTGGDLDSENCNGDSTFMLSGNTVADNIFSTAPGANYYDDVAMVTQINQVVDKWLYNGSTKMYNNSLGLVGIGTSNPQYPLDVSGNVKAAGGGSSPIGGVMASSICDSTGANCMKQSLLGSGANCGGSFMTGIANNNVNCSTVVSGSLGRPQSCVGKFVTGIAADGTLSCGF